MSQTCSCTASVCVWHWVYVTCVCAAGMGPKTEQADLQHAGTRRLSDGTQSQLRGILLTV